MYSIHPDIVIASIHTHIQFLGGPNSPQIELIDTRDDSRAWESLEILKSDDMYVIGQVFSSKVVDFFYHSSNRKGEIGAPSGLSVFWSGNQRDARIQGIQG